MITSKYLLYSIAVFFITSGLLVAAPVIIIFMTPYPYACDTHERLMHKMARPGKIAKYHFLNNVCKIPPVAGILSTYAGFFAVSDTDGKTTFPLKQHTQKLSLVITPEITPVIMHGTTIHHWELNPVSTCALYTFERIKDPDTNISLWNVTQENVPENCQVPLESIVLFARVKQIYVPIGASITNESTNIILPEIYIKNSKNLAQITAQWLNFAHFFGPLTTALSPKESSYSIMIKE